MTERVSGPWRMLAPTPLAGSRRLVLVSNRLPVTAQRKKGSFSYSKSAGGLASGLNAFLDSYRSHFPERKDCLWVGWPGITIDESEKESVRKTCLERYGALPVFFSAKEMNEFYLGFCNETLWPLFHYFPTYAEYREEYWNRYVSVNERFAETLAAILDPNDLVWVHDYHLMLLPRLLRSRMPNLMIGFFLHIPFPSFEIFRLLPPRWRFSILDGLLGSDLVGFHTHEYTHHFLQTVLRILGHDHTLGRIVLSGHVVRAETYPMGIDFERFEESASSLETHQEREALGRTLKGQKTVLSVDRLDYSKGILHRLQGYELFLERCPEYHGRVVLISVVVPSRIGVGKYDRMRKQIEEVVGHINGRFGTVAWTPVLYQYRNLALSALSALYAASDVALVTPLRDGMNLIAKEYVASRTNRTGVLILSEMAGAAKEMGEALIINPNDRGEIAAALHEALEMSEDEQGRRIDVMRERLRRYDVSRWAGEFLSDLLEMEDVRHQYTAKVLTPASREGLISAYAAARCRLLFLDYDGTLVPFARHPSLAEPPEGLKTLLGKLAADPRNTVVILSGRDRQSLDQWMGDWPIGIAAEHGFWVKPARGSWTKATHAAVVWKDKLRTILKRYADRLPGAHVEEKEFSLAWHYRSSDPEQSEPIASELIDRISGFTAGLDIQVLPGNKVVEVRTAGVHKGTAAARWLKEDCDFILGMGDDWTDEDLFRALPPSAWTIRIGVTQSNASYNLVAPEDVIALLEALAETDGSGA